MASSRVRLRPLLAAINLISMTKPYTSTREAAAQLTQEANERRPFQGIDLVEEDYQGLGGAELRPLASNVNEQAGRTSFAR
ncbi:hypothetical protein ACFL5O_01310 [Myxococcota bacterium]